MFHILSGIHQVQEVVRQAKSLTGGGVEPWVETAKRVAEKCSVDVKQGEGDLVPCLTQYLIRNSNWELMWLYPVCHFYFFCSLSTRCLHSLFLCIDIHLHHSNRTSTCNHACTEPIIILQEKRLLSPLNERACSLGEHPEKKSL